MDRLPPAQTLDAAQLQSERAYLTIQEWEGNQLDPEGYGWQLKDGLLEPIPMRQDPGPPSLMDIKMCGCTRGCNKRCSCYKDGRKCGSNCTCENCENTARSESDLDSESDSEGSECYESDDESMFFLPGD